MFLSFLGSNIIPHITEKVKWFDELFWYDLDVIRLSPLMRKGRLRALFILCVEKSGNAVDDRAIGVNGDEQIFRGVAVVVDLTRLLTDNFYDAEGFLSDFDCTADVGNGGSVKLSPDARVRVTTLNRDGEGGDDCIGLGGRHNVFTSFFLIVYILYHIFIDLSSSLINIL